MAATMTGKTKTVVSPAAKAARYTPNVGPASQLVG